MEWYNYVGKLFLDEEGINFVIFTSMLLLLTSFLHKKWLLFILQVTFVSFLYGVGMWVGWNGDYVYILPFVLAIIGLGLYAGYLNFKWLYFYLKKKKED